MKITFLLILVSVSAFAEGQDCFFCPPYLRWPWPQVPTDPIEYVKIEKVEYKRSQKATFCKRPEDMVDTIVLHHSETPNTDTPERINQYHLARGVPKDPWYMIAYSYVVNSSYQGESNVSNRVSEGRPLDIVGAHAGSNIFVSMDEDQKKMWKEGKITCGNKKKGFKVDPTIVKNGKIKANVTTIGVVVVGNYAPATIDNPNGYDPEEPRFPSEETLDLVARTSCQLQKKHPRMKTIKVHNDYHPTTCPGDLEKYLDKIKQLTRKLGCDFQ